MSHIRNRSGQLQRDAGDALPMGAFRPHPSWFEDHWLTEAFPSPPCAARRYLVRLAGLAGALIRQRLIGSRSIAHLAMPKTQTH